MFDLRMGASEPEPVALDTTLVGETVRRVREWLETAPEADALWKHLPALNLALAAHLKKRDDDLIGLVRRAVDRLNGAKDRDEQGNGTLADLILLNVRLAQSGGEATSKVGYTRQAWRAIEVAKSRYDEKLGFFRTGASDASNVFYTAGNARLAEAFYFVWRVLDEPELRPMAGEVLGHVSRMFDPNAALYADDETPDGDPEEAQRLETCAAAMQLFLTASETTGRRTYMTRASIVADFVSQKFDVGQASAPERAAYAEALSRLEQFCGEAKYGRMAREILEQELRHATPGIETAPLALAVEHAEHFPLHVVILGDVENDEIARALWVAALRERSSTRAIEVLHPVQNAARIEQLGYSMAGPGAVAYICIGPVCLPPVSTPGAFHSMVARTRV